MPTQDDPDRIPNAAPPGVPDGAFLMMPQPTVPGEVIPPIPMTFATGLTNPDVLGHRWAVLRCTDGTTTVDFRIPWQMAGQIGAAIAQGLAQMQQQAASEQNGGLIVPSPPGSLLIPRPGDARPPLNGGGRT
jgi:hypothetical protein